MTDLREYLQLIRKWWWLLALGAVIGAGAGYIREQTQVPTYQTKTTLVIGNSEELFNPSPGGIATSQRLAQNYSEMIRREAILQATTDSLGWDMSWTALQGKVSSRLVPNTQLFEILIKDTDPQRAKLIADEVAQQLIRQSLTEPAREREWYRDFIRSQIEDLQQKITAAQQQVQDIQQALEVETTATGISRRQEELQALQAKINTWQNNYVSLLAILQDRSTTNLTVIEPATVPTTPIGTTTYRRNILIAGVIGLALAFGAAFLIDYLDDRIKTATDVMQSLGLTTLGTVPRFRLTKKTINGGEKPASNQESFPAIESYRALRTTIQFSGQVLNNASASLLVTSSGIGEGKSTTASNLAIMMAHAGKKTILVDADLRRPTLHRTFNIPNELGLADLLADASLSTADALAEVEIKNLRLLPSGPIKPTSADFLGLPRMEKIIADLVNRSDILIIDSPPLLVVADASLLATRVDATILVIDAGRTRSQVAQRSVQLLEQVGVKPLGIVLNKFDPKADTRYYGDGYYYSYYYSENGQRSAKKEPARPKEEPDLTPGPSS